MTSGGKDILNVWEKSCVSGSLQSVCSEMGSFRVEFSEAKKKNLLCFLYISYLLSSLCSFITIIVCVCVCLHALARARMVFCICLITSDVCLPSNYA